MILRSVFARNRILILALFASLLWHLLWLSAIRVASPTVREPVKFSKVAFLGPVLDRGAMEVRVSPRERSFLENRYLSLIQGASSVKDDICCGKFAENKTSRAFNEKLIYLIDEAAGGPKVEPPVYIR